MHDANSARTTLVSILGLLLAVAALSPPPAQAQTPAATVEDGSNNVVFRSFVDGALLAPGSFGTGTIPTAGAGTRLMWHPAKAALRAGEVTGTQWDNTNIGDHSVAFGKNTTASGVRSVAMGAGTTASDNRTVAMGRNTTASAPQAVAMGNGTTASFDESVAMGDNTTAKANQAVAMGRLTTASGVNATAMGNVTTAAGSASLAAGAFAEVATNDDNTFVWNDGSGANDGSGSGSDQFSSGTSDGSSGVTGSQTFHVKATGGIRVITSGDNSTVTWISGGSSGWSSTSTRTAKTNLDPVDPQAVLEGVRSLEVSTWEYKDKDGEGQGIRHVGPMAEDFHRAFDVGSSEKAINSINADGVALGAIQGLAQKVETQKKRLDEQKARIADLEERLARLEAHSGGSVLASWTLPGALLLVLLTGGLLGVVLLQGRRRAGGDLRLRR